MKFAVLPCSASKLPYPAPAGLFYTGKIHRMIRRYCEHLGITDFMILSAKYGLVHDDEVIYPYNAILYHQSKGEKQKRVGMEAAGSLTDGVEFIAAESHLAKSTEIITALQDQGHKIVLAVTQSYLAALPPLPSILPPYHSMGSLSGNLKRSIEGNPLINSQAISDAEAVKLLAQFTSGLEFVHYCRANNIAMGLTRGLRLFKDHGTRYPGLSIF